MQPLPAGKTIDIDPASLRAMTLPELKQLGQTIGISFAGLEDRESALYTRLMQHAIVEIQA